MSSPGSLSAEEASGRRELPADEILAAVARYRVSVDCPEHVCAYLSRFPGLIPHVVPTVEKVRQTFGELAQLTLTINDDPETFDPYLKIYISLPKYGPDTMDQINRIQEPLDDVTAGQEGFFLVTTDHRLVGS